MILLTNIIKLTGPVCLIPFNVYNWQCAECYSSKSRNHLCCYHMLPWREQVCSLFFISHRAGSLSAHRYDKRPKNGATVSQRGCWCPDSNPIIYLPNLRREGRYSCQNQISLGWFLQIHKYQNIFNCVFLARGKEWKESLKNSLLLWTITPASLRLPRGCIHLVPLSKMK